MQRFEKQTYQHFHKCQEKDSQPSNCHIFQLSEHLPTPASSSVSLPNLKFSQSFFINSHFVRTSPVKECIHFPRKTLALRSRDFCGLLETQTKFLREVNTHLHKSKLLQNGIIVQVSPVSQQPNHWDIPLRPYRAGLNMGL